MATSPVLDDLIELTPPAEMGSSMTAKFSRATDARVIEELVRRGYTIKGVEHGTSETEKP